VRPHVLQVLRECEARFNETEAELAAQHAVAQAADASTRPDAEAADSAADNANDACTLQHADLGTLEREHGPLGSDAGQRMIEEVGTCGELPADVQQPADTDRDGQVD
jgi:hypothetical protein